MVIWDRRRQIGAGFPKREPAITIQVQPTLINSHNKLKILVRDIADSRYSIVDFVSSDLCWYLKMVHISNRKDDKARTDLVIKLKPFITKFLIFLHFLHQEINDMACPVIIFNLGDIDQTGKILQID